MLMMNIIELIQRLTRRILRPFFHFRKEKVWQKVRQSQSAEEKFSLIYARNLWGSSGSVSGNGSTLNFTANVRAELPVLFCTLRISRVLDAPCGDYNWMKHVVANSDIEYIGADIVRPLVEKLRLKYETSRVKFSCLDITRDALPAADLMICRDCLFHLSYKDAFKILNNLKRSEIEYLLVTSHLNKGSFSNLDIETGGYRKMDLFSPPFEFPSNYIAKIDDWAPPEPARALYLWHRSQLEHVFQRATEAELLTPHDG